MSTVERIEARQLLPGRGDPVPDAVVVLGDGVVVYAGPREGAPHTLGAHVTTCDTVLPGLWDCHAHLAGLSTLDLGRVVTERVEVRSMRAARDAAAALRMGFTSVRDVGGLGVHVERVRREGLVRAPRVFSANAILSTTGGHADIHDLPLDVVERFGDGGGMLRTCDGVDGVTRAVREQLRLDAKLIKVCASGGVLSEVDDPVHQQFTGDELRAVVETAAMADRVVAAHCHGAPGIEAAIVAGVRTIEHGSYLDADLAAAMAEHDVVLVPTRTIVDALVTELSTASGPSARSMRKAHEIADRHAAALHTAIEAGVMIASGTDIALSDPAHPVGWGRNARELELLVEAGMSPLQAIESATAMGPVTLGPQAPDAGMLLPGWDADVLALAEDPLADIGVLGRPGAIVGVWQLGERVVTGRFDGPQLVQPPALEGAGQA